MHFAAIRTILIQWRLEGTKGRAYLREKSVKEASLGCFAAVPVPTHTRSGVLLGWNYHTIGDAPRLQGLDERKMEEAEKRCKSPELGGQAGHGCCLNERGKEEVNKGT